MWLRVTATPPLGESVCKMAADKNLAVRLDDDDVNPAVRVRVETVERGLPAHRRRAAPQQHSYGKQQERGFFSRNNAVETLVEWAT